MSRVPRILSGQQLASLSLSPAEAFLVSQIDGVLSEQELSVVTGVHPRELSASLDRLARHGAVAFAETGGRPVASAPPPPPPQGQARVTAPVRPAGARYDPAELDEPVELDVEKKRRILDLFYRLDEVTYYELLGLAEDSDKKAVKAAYYAIAPEFHPDKFFRKNLGSYKAKIEAVFGRFTLAHDVLANPKRKVEYDEYLRTTQQNRAMSAALEQTQRDLALVEEAVRRAAAAAVGTAPAPQAYPTAPQVAPAPTMSADEALRLRREALARKLTGGRRTSPTPVQRPTTPPLRTPEMDAEVASRAAEALRQRHESAIAEAKRAQLRRYLETGKAALERQDFAGAANAYRIAASLEPDDPAVQATCNEAMRLAATALADGYWKQAVYEEGQERWAEAALSYSKVCAGRPDDGAAHERVAFATLKSSTNIRRAVEFARKAVELSPRTPEMRVTLARAYAAAGLDKSKHGELDRAVELAGDNPRVQAMVAQVRSLAAREAPKDAPKDGKGT